MRIYDLVLENIGPFEKEKLDFIKPEDDIDRPPVIIITGENGSGKTIIIDAIRAILIGRYGAIERDITSSDDFNIQSKMRLDDKETIINLNSVSKKESSIYTNNIELNYAFSYVRDKNSGIEVSSIVNYWSSKLSSDRFDIENIKAPNNNYVSNSLSGIHTNIEVTELISFFDYLKDSNDESEKELGLRIFEIVKNIVKLSIQNGTLSHVSRVNLKPIIQIDEKKISLDKLSSGNLYLIQRFLFLVKQMYNICLDKKISPNEMTKIEGLLLIDEAENHLHPRWQKVFLKNILSLFPNMQIIVTTHSPFIVSSIENARVFVCKSELGNSFVSEETARFTNKPIEEILISPLFNTSSFNEDISELINKREQAIKEKNTSLENEIEEELLRINPTYFNYLNINELLNSIKK